MSLRSTATLLAAVLAVLCPASALAADSSGVPPIVPLKSGWQFKPDPQIQGATMALEKWEASPGWRSVTIPHVFDPRPLASEFHGTVGWYKLTFRGPTARKGFGWAFSFQQVRRKMIAWLNGRRIGTNADPYVPFRLPASGLKAGQQNTLVVRVDNRKGSEPREGWWNWGGITRAVNLVPRGQVALEGPALMSQVSCPENQDNPNCKAAFEFDGTVVNRSAFDQPADTVTVRLVPPGGGTPIVGQGTARSLHSGESTRLTFSIPVPDPDLWSPDSPDLYDATVTTAAGDVVGQVDHLRPGLREISVRNGLLELNGRQVELRGASIIEDMPGHGPALTDSDIDTIVSQLKQVHANITRSHYLLNPKLLNALDEAGIMVWSQAPIYHRDRRLVTEAQRSAALATLRGTVLAARTHPSVITNSVANELSVVPDTVPGTKAYLDDAYLTAKDLDPAAPVGIDLLSYPGYGHQETYAQFDVLGINSYFGWYPGKANHSTANIADLGPYLDSMRQMYPSQGLVVTEFGAESTFNGPATQKETFAFQTNYVQQVLSIVKDRPFVAGAIYWTLREFAVKPHWDGGANRHVPRDSIHNKGLITYEGKPKPAFAATARDFASIPLYRHISQAQALGVPDSSHHGLLLALGAAFVVLLLLVIDGWALAGILRARREPRPEAEPETAPAQAA